MTNEQRGLRWVAAAVAGGLAVFVTWSAFASGKQGLTTLLIITGSLQIFGKSVIFSGLLPDFSFGPFTIALYALLFDLAISILLLGLSNRFEKLPVVGAAIAVARGKARAVLETYPRLRRMAFWGVALFVFLPLPASGAVTGTFAAILLGVPRLAALGAIGLGSVATGVLFAALAVLLREQGKQLLLNPWMGLAGLVAFVLFLWFAYRHAAKILKQE